MRRYVVVLFSVSRPYTISICSTHSYTLVMSVYCPHTYHTIWSSVYHTSNKIDFGRQLDLSCYIQCVFVFLSSVSVRLFWWVQISAGSLNTTWYDVSNGMYPLVHTLNCTTISIRRMYMIYHSPTLYCYSCYRLCFSLSHTLCLSLCVFICVRCVWLPLGTVQFEFCSNLSNSRLWMPPEQTKKQIIINQIANLSVSNVSIPFVSMCVLLTIFCFWC